MKPKPTHHIIDGVYWFGTDGPEGFTPHVLRRDGPGHIAEYGYERYDILQNFNFKGIVRIHPEGYVEIGGDEV